MTNWIENSLTHVGDMIIEHLPQLGDGAIRIGGATLPYAELENLMTTLSELGEHAGVLPHLDFHAIIADARQELAKAEHKLEGGPAPTTAPTPESGTPASSSTPATATDTPLDTNQLQ